MDRFVTVILVISLICIALGVIGSFADTAACPEGWVEVAGPAECELAPTN